MTKASHFIQYRILNDQTNFPERLVEVHAAESEISDFARDGYLIRPGLIREKELAEFRQELDRISAQELEAGTKENYPGNALFIRFLLDKSRVFVPLFYRPEIVSVVRAMLGPQVQLADMAARVNFPGIANQQLYWHIHNRVVPQPLPPFFVYPHAIDALIYLDDVMENEGPLCVLPGSHRDLHLYFADRDISDKPDQVILPVKAGTCVLMHSNLWHRTLPTSEATRHRRLLLLEYSPSWLKLGFSKGIKPENPLSEELFEQGDGERRELLGFFQWG